MKLPFVSQPLRAAALFLSGLLSACGDPPPVPGPAADFAHDGRAAMADAVGRAKKAETAGDGAGAEEAWEAALARDPDHASALYATARLRRDRGDAAGALERLRSLLRLDPHAGRAHLLAAEVLSDPGSGAVRDLAAAEIEARRALDLNPEESGPYLALGRVLWLAGKNGPAAETLASAARMNPRDTESRSLLGVLHLRSGERDRAGMRFREALRAGRPAGAEAGADVPGEGDTTDSLDPDRPPTEGELRASAGLALLGHPPAGAREGDPLPGDLRRRLLALLRERGTGEAVLDGDGDGSPDLAAVAAGGSEGEGAFTAVRWQERVLVIPR